MSNHLVQSDTEESVQSLGFVDKETTRLPYVYLIIVCQKKQQTLSSRVHAWRRVSSIVTSSFGTNCGVICNRSNLEVTVFLFFCSSLVVDLMKEIGRWACTITLLVLQYFHVFVNARTFLIRPTSSVTSSWTSCVALPK